METTEDIKRRDQAIGHLFRRLNEVASQTFWNTVHDEVQGLLNPPPTYKEVTVERWECDVCGGIHRECPGKCELYVPQGICANTSSFTKLTGTRRVPVEQPVRKSIRAEISHNREGLDVDDLTVFPPDGTPVTVSWEE